MPDPTDDDLQRVASYLNFAPWTWAEHRELLERVYRNAQYKADVLRRDLWSLVAQETAEMLGVR